ncbi:hypothetical protein X729_32520 [Mesorhizobium sp. L103C131B0]|nr:hypothetical protein X729_32520 [Mesorhizobium sp. L103C131B0]
MAYMTMDKFRVIAIVRRIVFGQPIFGQICSSALTTSSAR